MLALLGVKGLRGVQQESETHSSAPISRPFPSKITAIIIYRSDFCFLKFWGLLFPWLHPIETSGATA